MRQRVLGLVAVSVTAASVALVRAEPPAQFPLSQNATPVSKSSDNSQTPPPARLEPVPSVGPNMPEQMPASATPAAGAPAKSPPPSRRPTVDLRDDHIGPVDSIWGKADYLFWWTKNGPLPVALAATGPALPEAVPTTTLLGGSNLDYRGRSGGQLTIGTWLDDHHLFGIDARGFALERPTVSGSVIGDANGNPVLSRPVMASGIVGQQGAPGAANFSFPGVITGGLLVTSASRFWGAETNVVRNVLDDLHLSVDLSLGFRYLDLDENLLVAQNATALSATYPDGLPNPLSPFAATGTLLPGSATAVADAFRTRNQIFAGQVGAHVGWRANIWTIDVDSRVALGSNHQVLNVTGMTQFTAPGTAPQTFAGGLLAQPSNIGRQSTNWFVVVPEIGAQLGCQLAKNIQAHVGYDFLFINSVIRPGNQVNPNVNLNRIPPAATPFGPQEPAPLFRQSNFWAHGITAGVTLTY